MLRQCAVFAALLSAVIDPCAAFTVQSQGASLPPLSLAARLGLPEAVVGHRPAGACGSTSAPAPPPRDATLPFLSVRQDWCGRPSPPAAASQARGPAPSARCAWAAATCRVCRTRLQESKDTRYLRGCLAAWLSARPEQPPPGVWCAPRARFVLALTAVPSACSSWTSGAACSGNASCTLGRILTTSTPTRCVLGCSVPTYCCSACSGSADGFGQAARLLGSRAVL